MRVIEIFEEVYYRTAIQFLQEDRRPKPTVSDDHVRIELRRFAGLIDRMRRPDGIFKRARAIVRGLSGAPTQFERDASDSIMHAARMVREEHTLHIRLLGEPREYWAKLAREIRMDT
jgi:hypothetical protein